MQRGSSWSTFKFTGLLVLASAASGQSVELIDELGDGLGDGLTGPSKVALDGAGNVYLADRGGSVLQFSVEGVISKVFDLAGTLLTNVTSMAVGADGTLYVLDGVLDKAVRVDLNGAVTLLIDQTGDGLGNVLATAMDIAVDGSGNAYVCGFSSDNVFKITTTGAITEVIDTDGAGPGTRLSGPRFVTTDAAGNAYVTGSQSGNAFRITPGGSITEIINGVGDGRGNPLILPMGIAVDSSGTAYVAGWFSGNVFSIAPDGTTTVIIDGPSTPGDGLLFPFVVAAHDSGDAYVAGSQSHNVFRISPEGQIVELIDQSGDGQGNELLVPLGIAVDENGHAYVSGNVSGNLFFTTPNQAPVFDSASPCGQVLETTAGVPVSFDVTAADGVFNRLLLVTSPLPTGAVATPATATGNPASLTFEWTPGVADAGSHLLNFVCFDQTGVYASCQLTIEVAECYLLVGAGLGSDSVAAGGHTFTTQLLSVTAAYPVTMENSAELILGELGRGTSSFLSFPSTAPLVPIPLGGRGVAQLPTVPGQLFFTQVVMWNPEGFPTNPEQWSRGLATYVSTSGQLTTLPFGQANGMHLRASLEKDSSGTYRLKFPFSIEGL